LTTLLDSKILIRSSMSNVPYKIYNKHDRDQIISQEMVKSTHLRIFCAHQMYEQVRESIVLSWV
jgi:hypothetical protein